jgi:hypothetical protein
MARLMVIPLEDKGDAILIVSRHAESAVVGFVCEATIAGLFEHRLSTAECVAFVERHMQTFERILVQKSGEEIFVDDALACVEITDRDLIRSGVTKAR